MSGDREDTFLCFKCEETLPRTKYARSDTCEECYKATGRSLIVECRNCGGTFHCSKIVWRGMCKECYDISTREKVWVNLVSPRKCIQRKVLQEYDPKTGKPKYTPGMEIKVYPYLGGGGKICPLYPNAPKFLYAGE